MRPPLLSTTLLLSLALFLLPALVVAQERPSPSSDNIPDLQGRWIKELVLTSTYRIALVTRFTNTATTHLLVDIEQEGRELEFKTQVCRIELDDTAPGFRPEISDDFRRSLPEGRRRATLTPRNGEWAIQVHRAWDVQGVRMSDPDHESLPDSPDDPRVFDQEGDGRPGFTVAIHGPLGGTIQLARRNWDHLSGRVHNPDSISGKVIWQSEQVVLDASRRLLRTSPTTTPDLDRSTFRMRRIPPNTTCDDLSRNPTLFFSTP